MFRVTIFCLAFAFAWGGQASAAPRKLTLREADRAIELAIQAEIAGDFAGPRQELEARVRGATRPEELAGRARLEAWLAGMATREAALASHGKSARGYLEALSSLEGFGLDRTDLWWMRAQRDVPGLAARYAETARVRLQLDDVTPAALEGSIAQHFVPALARHEVRRLTDEAGAFTVRLVLDAGEATEVVGGVRVRAEASLIVLRPGASEPEVVATITKRRSETRRAEAQARAFAARRALDEAAWSLVYLLRVETLRSLAPVL
jgi:hypothetical protein